MGDAFGLDFKDVETKLGRKIPESLARSITDQGRLLEDAAEAETPPVTPTVPFYQESASASVRLQRKMTFLKQEMARLRAIDIELMRQLLSINEGIESIRWLLEERAGLAGDGSPDSSLTGSLLSLSESPSGGSGSCGSLRSRDSDGLDAVSVGSYLDALADDLLPGETDPGFFSEDPPVPDKGGSHRGANSDEYYCFG